MKLTYALAALMSIAASHAPASEGPSSLTGIRYNVQSPVSRVTMRFQGAVVYTVRETNRQLTLGLSHMRVASPPGAARLAFQTGLIHTVVVDRLPGDSTRVVISLAEGAGCTVRLVPGTNELVVEAVKAKSLVASLSKPGTRAAATVRKPPSAPKAEPKQSLVDIPAIARNQVDAESLTQHVETAGMPQSRTAATSLPLLSPVVLIGVLAILGAAGVGLLLIIASRRQHGVDSKSIIAVPPPQHTEPSRTKSVKAQREPDPADESGIQSDESSADAQDEVDDATLKLGRSFQRGAAEMALVTKLRATSHAPGGKNALGKKLGANSTPAQRTTTAKKLGVSTGELILAIQLQQFAQKSLRKGSGQ